jgi:UDP-N-acetylmuramate--alanine ligase
MSHLFHGPNLDIFDDYAHNPGKISACVQTIRAAWPSRRFIAVYQPHRYSRLETMYNEMLEALRGVDLVFVAPVYSAGEVTRSDFSPAKIAADLSERLWMHLRSY